MSREIKFRFFMKNFSEEELNDPEMKDEIEECGIGFMDIPDWINFENKTIKYDSDIYEYGNGNVEIMQYTGVRDCNGKEVYEGDILYDEHLDERYVVNFFEGSYVMEETEAGTTSYIDTDTDTEIIGNIYENSNLLGEE